MQPPPGPCAKQQASALPLLLQRAHGACAPCGAVMAAATAAEPTATRLAWPSGSRLRFLMGCGRRGLVLGGVVARGGSIHVAVRVSSTGAVVLTERTWGSSTHRKDLLSGVAARAGGLA